MAKNNHKQMATPPPPPPEILPHVIKQFQDGFFPFMFVLLLFEAGPWIWLKLMKIWQFVGL